MMSVTSKRIRLSLATALLAAVLPTCLAAQDAPADLPRAVSLLGASEPGEIRLRLTAEQLESVGIPEIAYTAADREVADLADIGLRTLRFGSRIEGTFRSALGSLTFRSTVRPDGRILVENVLPNRRGTLSLLISLETRTAEPGYPAGVRITPADRFLFRALAVALTREVGDKTAETDLLLRAAQLWGDHPLQEVGLRRIAAKIDKSWTNLCGRSSAALAHDATDHGLITETLAVGPNSANCRSRCGAGCGALIGTSAWTVDCGEHDRCEQHHSCCVSCQDEFNSASDDYLFASNCRLSGW